MQQAAPASLDRYILPALPGVVISLAGAIVAWIRSTAQRAAGARIGEALKEALAPLCLKVDQLKDAIASLDKTMAVQEANHAALVARVDAMEQR